MKDIEAAIEDAFLSWIATWDLQDMTIKEIYEAGFRHGVQAAEIEHGIVQVSE